MLTDTAGRLSNGYRCVISKNRNFLISDYESAVVATDVLDLNTVQPVLQGLFGEVGGIMSVAKKSVREGDAYPGFRQAAQEEFGDALWYLAALCRRCDVSLNDLFAAVASNETYETCIAANDSTVGAIARIAVPARPGELDATLAELGKATVTLFDTPTSREALQTFVARYLDALHAAKLSFSAVMQGNLQKARGAFILPNLAELPDFDSAFGPDEQLPRQFSIHISQRASGKSYLQWNNVFIGDPLTDNISDADGYRFHDVFHFAFAAIMHWSPVVRSLIKHKRKSRPSYDEEQDSGRAIVVEEGLTAWLFCRARELKYFEGQTKVSLGLRKTIHEFVSGYEVDQCPLSLWERAIVQGYDVFRRVRDNRGGWVIGDRHTRTLSYQALEE
jgi:hypothetical protein